MQNTDEERSHFFPEGLPQRNSRPKIRSEQNPFEWFWGISPQMAELRKKIELIEKNRVHVLIVGETGSGKEVVAREIHLRRHGKVENPQEPFLPVNCASIPEALFESILFGHERGAFTSARENQMGKFELAKDGSLFLDEIQSLGLKSQSKLLRVIQHSEIEKLGARKGRKAKCSVICSTNIPLEILLEQKKFRRDLYYRLNVFPLFITPLRHRLEDLPFLCNFFLEKIQTNFGLEKKDISPEVFNRFLEYKWPGNLRELEHTLIYASLRAQSCIQEKDLPEVFSGQLKNFLRKGNWDVALA